MTTATLTRGNLPRVYWSAVFAGALCAMAIQIILWLIGAAFGFAARPVDSRELGAFSALWSVLTPFAATFIGAMIASRISPESQAAGAYLHGVLVWCISLVAGALLLTGLFAALSTTGVRPAPADTVRDMAAMSGAAAVSALVSLAGALVGALVGRRSALSEVRPSGRRYGEEKALGPEDRLAEGKPPEVGAKGRFERPGELPRH